MKNSGSEMVTSESTDVTPSHARPRISVASTPNATPTGIAIAADTAARNTVLPRRSPISSATGRPFASEWPMFPRSRPAAQAA